MANKTYEVVGSTAYRGTAPGDSFSASLSEAEERRAIERGAIKEKKKSSNGGKKPSDSSK